MNWIKELFDLYDKNESVAGSIGIGRYGEPLVLIPVFHTTVTAQITVSIGADGTFLGAERVVDEDKMTLIPVTEKSAVRTAGVEAHPLCDNLKYLAGDYHDFVIPVKKKDFSENHRLYMEGLRKWSESEFSHEKVLAVYRYLEKDSLMKDLIDQGILILDEHQKVSEKEKIQNVAQADAFVRFCVEKKWEGQDRTLFDEKTWVPKECWLDRSLQEAYISYVRSQKKTQGLSYLTGKTETITYLHPKKIRNEGDGAKLISSNDETDFTFRGRFVNKEEAFAIGYEDSQKAHNALKWIIRKQGKNWNNLCVVIWESDLKELPEWSVDTDKACDQYEEWESWEDEEKETYSGTDPKTAARFQAAIAGYQKAINIKPDSRTMLMAFDAATTGRLAIMACQEFSTSMYLKNLNQWHENCGWIHPKYKDKGYYEYYGIVGVRDIANLLYGAERKGDMSLKGSAEKMISETCKRLLPCILSGKPIPEDMVYLAVRRASSPVSYESSMNWRRTLALACSFVRKKRMERDGEVWTVALNNERRDRSYLYGRLLAVADRIEYQAQLKDIRRIKKREDEEKYAEEGAERKGERKEIRQTNARRFMSAFSQRPFQTWKIIEERIEPYKEKLDTVECLYYEHLIEEIFNNFEEGDYEKSDSLDGLYLLGFHTQAYALRKKKGEESNE